MKHLKWGLAEDSNNADLKKIKKDIIALHARRECGKMKEGTTE